MINIFIFQLIFSEKYLFFLYNFDILQLIVRDLSSYRSIIYWTNFTLKISRFFRKNLIARESTTLSKNLIFDLKRFWRCATRIIIATARLIVLCLYLKCFFKQIKEKFNDFVKKQKQSIFFSSPSQFLFKNFVLFGKKWGKTDLSENDENKFKVFTEHTEKSVEMSNQVWHICKNGEKIQITHKRKVVFREV